MRSGVVSFTHALIADSDPARYFSFRGARMIENTSRWSRQRSRPVADGCLVPRRDVRDRGDLRVEGVEPAQQLGEDGRQLVALTVVERGEVGPVAVGHDADLHRPAGGDRYERRPVVAAGDDARAGRDLPGEQIPEQIVAAGAAVTLGLAQHRFGPRHDERVGVDLAVGMVEGDADLPAPVLEHRHLGDAGPRRQLGGAVGPRLDDGAHPLPPSWWKWVSWSLVKHTTSQRPTAGTSGATPSEVFGAPEGFVRPSGAGNPPVGRPAKDGKRFSNTTTS